MEARWLHFLHGQCWLLIVMKVLARSWGIGLEACVVLEKSSHIDREDLLSSVKAILEDVLLLCKAAQLSSTHCSFHLSMNLTPT